MDTLTIKHIMELLAESGTATEIAWIWFYGNLIESVLVIGFLSTVSFFGYKLIKNMQ